MQTDGLDWGEGYRPLGRRALAEIIEGRMAEDVDRWLGNLDGAAACDRRNKTGAGGLKRPVLVVLSLHPDGRKEIVDYRLARAESAAEWERFLDDLYARGLTGEGLEMTCVDGGGQGLPAALPTAYHGIPIQRCWTHKTRPRQGSQGRSGCRQAGSSRCRPNHTEARSAAKRKRWEDACPRAVACLRDDLDDLLTCFRYKDPDQRRQVRTTNAIERRFREVRRRTRPTGAFQDRTSMGGGSVWS